MCSNILAPLTKTVFALHILFEMLFILKAIKSHLSSSNYESRLKGSEPDLDPVNCQG